MQLQLSAYPNKELYQRLLAYYLQNSSEITRVKSNRDAFYTLIFTDDIMADKHYTTICKFVDKSMYRLELQGRKLYVIPQFLDKSIAVKYILSQCKNDLVITSGDSCVDELFIREGQLRILPNHASIDIENSARTSNSGINAGEEILLFVKTLLMR